MFSAFSWSAYFLFIGSCIGIYLVVISFFYNRHAIINFLAGRSEKMQAAIGAPVATPGFSQPAREIISALEQVIRNAAALHITRPELLFSIRQLLKQSPDLANPFVKPGINEFILQRAKEQLPYDLDETEIEGLWVE